MNGLKLLIIPGSARSGSWNRKLANVAGEIARKAGATVTELDLRALALPIYDGDLEVASGVPAAALQLQDAVLEADAVLFVTPEYNGFPTPLVINAMDWLSRIQPKPPRPSGLAATANKPAGVLAASPGPNGALRSMNFLRQYLQMAFAMIVVPQQFALGKANEAFDEAGALKDPKAQQAVETALGALGKLAQSLKK